MYALPIDIQVKGKVKVEQFVAKRDYELLIIIVGFLPWDPRKQSPSRTRLLRMPALSLDRLASHHMF